jgi:hypothetical protein
MNDDIVPAALAGEGAEFTTSTTFLWRNRQLLQPLSHTVRFNRRPVHFVKQLDL